MTEDKTQKQILVEVLESLDLSLLPEEALRFLTDYLTSPSAHAKVTTLISELDRLTNRIDFVDHYEHVGYQKKKTP